MKGVQSAAPKKSVLLSIYVSLAVYYDVSAHGLLSSEGWFLAARKVRHIVNFCRIYQVLPSEMYVLLGAYSDGDGVEL